MRKQTGKTAKTPKQLERHMKGAANHRRIQILQLVAKHEGITVDDIAQKLDCNFKTISEHTRRLAQTGLLNKTYRGHTVEHRLSPYGKSFCRFFESF